MIKAGKFPRLYHCRYVRGFAAKTYCNKKEHPMDALLKYFYIGLMPLWSRCERCCTGLRNTVYCQCIIQGDNIATAKLT